MIYKTLRVDANFTVSEAVKFIAETVNCSSLLVGSEGLFVPDEKRWLDDGTPLSAYETLQDVEHIEFKDKNATAAPGQKPGDDDCCIIL
uniref:Talin N-terminal F0 domain-containing protein n=1 Tax=Arcella intermedia TaxID=1963864 RepID=A0A6B2LTR2_9EUKA